jgi:hypothetical protein
MTRHKKYDIDLVRPGADKGSKIDIADLFVKDIIKRSMVSRHETIVEPPYCIDANIYCHIWLLVYCRKVKTSDERNCNSNVF